MRSAAGPVASSETWRVSGARLLPHSPFRTLTSVPGWGCVRAGNYGAALGDPSRWPGPRGRSTAPPVSRRCSTSLLAAAATAGSAAKAASNYGAH